MLRISRNASPGCKRMLKDIRFKAKKNNIKLLFTTDKIITPKGDVSSIGYFDDKRRVLAVSNFRDLNVFIPILAHESSHLDQFLEDTFLWDKCSPGYNLFFNWLNGDDLDMHRVKESVHDIIRLERDCELRAINKLKSYKIKFDIKRYIKTMNAYLYGYLFFMEKRSWIPGIYLKDYITKASPSKIHDSYEEIPVNLRKAFDKAYAEVMTD